VNDLWSSPRSSTYVFGRGWNRTDHDSPDREGVPIRPSGEGSLPRSQRHGLIVGAQETYPHLFDICPLTMRTQGILLVNDAILMTALRSADGELFHLVVDPLDPLPL